jgi:hypothetical protein
MECLKRPVSEGNALLGNHLRFNEYNDIFLTYKTYYQVEPRQLFKKMYDIKALLF